MTFEPGPYTNVSVLNGKTDPGDCRIFWFKPGVYYFNYTGTWTISRGTLVAGTPTNTLSTAVEPSVPGACVSPIPPDPHRSRGTPAMRSVAIYGKPV